MTIRWFTDADRQDMRDAAEERRVLDELVRKYTTYREITPEERAEAIDYAKKHGYVCKPLQIDPRWRD